MIDSNEINAIVAAKVTETVAEQVADLFKNDTALVANLRSQAVSLLVRNFNLDDLVKKGIARQIAAEVAEMLVSPDSNLLDADLINSTVANSIAEATNSQIGSLITKDPKLLGALKSQAVTTLVSRLSESSNIERLISNKIAERFEAEFDGIGIHNSATKREITIMDDGVVIDNTLTSTNVIVTDELSTNNISVRGNLSVNGSVDISSSAWDALSKRITLAAADEITLAVKKDMIDAVIAQTDNLNFTQININGKPAISGNTLGAQITDSTLTKIGKLKGLTVTGTATVGVIHSEDKRVGINTRTPNAALDVWDEEVEILVGKLKEQTAFIGTNRPQSLVLGVNRSEDLTIDTDGVVTIKKLKLGHRTIKHGDTQPGYSGVPGDLVLNTKLTVENPIFAWYCLHEYSWVALKATV